jgi:large subunit ribosomal protein L5
MSTTLDVRLKSRYRSEIAPALKTQFGFKNPMQIPTLVKIVVNMGVGEAARDSKLIEGAVRDLTIITGQKPQVTKSRKSIAQFKLREGQPIGAHVTIRGDRMWSLQIVCFQSLFHVSATSVVFHQNNLMARETTHSV